MPDLSIDVRAEEIVRSLARIITAPEPGECLLCFVHRMLTEFGCACTNLRFAAAYRDAVAPRATGLERRLGSQGGFCDCEIFMNAWEVDRRLWTPEREVECDDGCVEVYDAEPPEVLPACTSVRRGSTQPCGIWEPQRRGWW